MRKNSDGLAEMVRSVLISGSGNQIRIRYSLLDGLPLVLRKISISKKLSTEHKGIVRC